jgi:hypothetical protein
MFFKTKIFRSAKGDVLTIPTRKFPTVLIHRSSLTANFQVLWTLKTATAHVLLRFARDVGFTFEVRPFRPEGAQLLVPVLVLHLNTSRQTLAYALVSIGPDDRSTFFRQFLDVDLFATDTEIVTRCGSDDLPIPSAIAEALRRGTSKASPEPSLEIVDDGEGRL